MAGIGGVTMPRLYDNQWAQASRDFRRENPLCAWCLAGGRPRSAEVVDHIRPHKRNPYLFRDYGNWQSLCKSCHAAKTALDTAGLVVDWPLRRDVTVCCALDGHADFYVPTASLLAANRVAIEHLARTSGRCRVRVPGLRDAYRVARSLGAALCVDKDPQP